MKFTTAFSNVLLVSVLAVANAKAVTRAAQDIWSPKIISPSTTTVWHAGQHEAVTWDTSDAPAHVSNAALVIFHDDVTQTSTVLAQNFDLHAGSVDVTVPAGAVGAAHITLFGDSGNNSPEFTVV